MYRTIAVVGLGYVGLPLALTFYQQGYHVIGLDKDPRKLEAIERGESYLPDIENHLLVEAGGSGRWRVTDQASAIREAQAIIICVPTPVRDQTPDLSYLISAAESLAPHLVRQQLVILESSTYPGTTRDVLMPILEKSGLRTGDDLYIGYSPERIDPGNRAYPFPSIPKIISGITEACLVQTHHLYNSVFDRLVSVSTPESAEMTKLLENTYRFINISFINEFARICDRMKLDVWEIIDAAATKPYGFSRFMPGPGVGGHCIPVDPLYLQWKAEQLGMNSRFIELSEHINKSMPQYIVERLREHFHTESLSGRRILVVGVTYKPDVSDVRESSAMDLLKLLVEEGCEVSYHDELVPWITLEGDSLLSTSLSPETIADSDVAIIATAHQGLPVSLLMEHASLIYDTRNVTRGLSGKATVLRLGGGE
ncbi:nucleotide sugar dehydrogenase [Paenibacillus daejeonensis]|uniref:nucleotide sugar dehydrogenase n=1 Tax=Paenibacillus daejeonensis TaxID=135193 RepID=UPI0003717136|nr:nucleotide sugar dehydrogenase [Paenibacillus daejeonensis]